MGNALSALIAPNEAADENERKKKEQLELMMKLADARLDTFQGELEKMFLDRESAMKTSVPGKRALRFERHVAVDAESTPGKGVEDAVDSFFGASETGAKGVLDGFKSVVKTGLSAILGDSSAGESYDKKFFVCMKHNAIIRVDMYTYKYTFGSKGVVDVHKNILAYILCISVVDHRDVTLDELIYLASEFAGDGDVGPGSGFQQYLEMIMKTWNALRAIDPLPVSGRPALEYPVNLQLPVRTTPSA
ncbi:uncharacterized protein LY79DRAFT_608563 [Colletotrichum navitas]|uniref:Uncharacterized protein n=1 Tax=Colletotrichum navitas TaxID=681940 RepID=A0AAD8V2E5_9PEZI|nr:uncharacterized protein LY79DRAFT_608563 [Colletotrichum navitas]KAK1589755.1 hypothetical protein LY79DRAFT_608563 [Colletotrichum navitas]